MKIDTRIEDNGCIIVKPIGEMVANTSGQLSSMIDKFAEEGQSRFFLNMDRMSFMDSSGLRECLEINTRGKEENLEIIFYNLNNIVRKLFRITGADQDLFIVESPGFEGAVGGDFVGQADSLSFTIAPLYDEIDHARAKIIEFCRKHYSGEEFEASIGDLALAATEAMNNVVEHTRSSQVKIEMSVQDNQIIFRVSNSEARFDPTRENSTSTTQKGDDFPEGGFGLSIMKQLADQLSYDYVDGRNVLTIVKKMR